MFHSEHNRLVGYMQDLVTTQNIDLNEWKLPNGQWNGERLFQAARYVTEMEYQHIVFEDFARKIQPGINGFNVFTQSDTGIDPAIKAEFAHATYRFGHSMLTETIDRKTNNGTDIGMPLLDAFLNPTAYYASTAGTLNPKQAAGAIAMGMTDQVGAELDEFVTDTLRNNVLGLPLDLASLNLARGRDTGIPSLNNFRSQLYTSTGESSLKPYTSWVDFGQNLKHPDSVVNFMAAYGTHPTITAATSIVDKRAAAQRLFDMDTADALTPTDSFEFVNSTGAWADEATGLNNVDLWVGGLAEYQNLFGGLLGSTFNYIFERQMTDLQDGDRLYYLSRTSGLNLRTQLEGNSLSELIMRNTDASALKADVFGVADCEFEMANITATTGNSVADDPASACDESALLMRMADGTIRYRVTNSVDRAGLNAQSTFNGLDNAAPRIPHWRGTGSGAASTTTPSGATTATTSSKAMMAPTSSSAAKATTASRTPTVTTSSRADPATTRSTPDPAWTSSCPVRATTSPTAASTATKRSRVKATTWSSPATVRTQCSAAAAMTGRKAATPTTCCRVTAAHRSSTTSTLRAMMS